MRPVGRLGLVFERPDWPQAAALIGQKRRLEAAADKAAWPPPMMTVPDTTATPATTFRSIFTKDFCVFL